MFPYRRPQNQVPTIDDILPTNTDQPENVQEKLRRGANSDKDDDNNDNPETLQSVESEHLDSFYGDDNDDDNNNEGRSLGSYFLLYNFFYLVLVYWLLFYFWLLWFWIIKYLPIVVLFWLLH